MFPPRKAPTLPPRSGPIVGILAEMSPAIQNIDSDSHAISSAHDVDDSNKGDEKSEIVQMSLSDIEGDADRTDDLKGADLYNRADKVELTPVEALTWDVSGDQSPCKNGTGFKSQ